MAQIQLQTTRSTIIEGRRVAGWLYLEGDGKAGWYIKTWPVDSDPIDDYWVEGTQFYEMLSLQSSGHTIPISKIEVGRQISDIEPAKRSAVLAAIAEWERVAK